MKIEDILPIILGIISIFFIGLVAYSLLFSETNNVDCYEFYAKQYCRLNNMTWDGYNHLPFPISGFICLQELGTERIGYKEYEKRFYFSEYEKKECTNKPKIYWSK